MFERTPVTLTSEQGHSYKHAQVLSHTILIQDVMITVLIVSK